MANLLTNFTRIPNNPKKMVSPEAINKLYINAYAYYNKLTELFFATIKIYFFKYLY